MSLYHVNKLPSEISSKIFNPSNDRVMRLSEELAISLFVDKKGNFSRELHDAALVKEEG